MKTTTTPAPVAVEPRHECDTCGRAVFADGTKGGGYMGADGVWVKSWACCGTCCRAPSLPKRAATAVLLLIGLLCFAPVASAADDQPPLHAGDEVLVLNPSWFNQRGRLVEIQPATADHPAFYIVRVNGVESRYVRSELMKW